MNTPINDAFEWLYELSSLVPRHSTRREAALRECRNISQDNNSPIFCDFSSAPTNLHTTYLKKKTRSVFLHRYGQF